MSACWICCHTVWLWCSDVTLIRSLTLGTSLAQQCYVASHQMINFSTNHLFTELSARVASENLLKTLNVTSFHFRTQTLHLSWLAVTQLSFWQLSSAPSSHTLRFRQSWAEAELSRAPATLQMIQRNFHILSSTEASSRGYSNQCDPAHFVGHLSIYGKPASNPANPGWGSRYKEVR